MFPSAFSFAVDGKKGTDPLLADPQLAAVLSRMQKGTEETNGQGRSSSVPSCSAED